MVTVEMTSHLYRFFPQLENRVVQVQPGSVAAVLQQVEQQAAGFTDYVLDERGALRRHVFAAINNALVIDRQTLSDKVPEGGTLYIFQALTGG